MCFSVGEMSPCGVCRSSNLCIMRFFVPGWAPGQGNSGRGLGSARHRGLGQCGPAPAVPMHGSAAGRGRVRQCAQY